MSAITTTGRGFEFGTDVSRASNVTEALAAARLDWDLRMIPAENLTVLTDDGVISTSIPDRSLVVRTDNFVTLSANAGSKYQIVNNTSAFAVGDALLAEGATMKRAGEFDHGRRVFMDFDFPQHHVGLADGNDLVTFGARITTAHDGGGKVVAEIVGKRLWCTNGCTVTMEGLPHVFKVSHTASAMDRLADAERIMAGAGAYVTAFAGAARQLLDTPMSNAEFCTYIDTMFPRPDVNLATRGGKSSMAQWEKQRDELLKLWKFADTNELGRHTRWGGFNAVTEYLDWGSRVAVTSRTASVVEARALRQFENAHQGTRDRAWQYALAA